MKKTAGRGAGQSAAKHRNRDGVAGPLTRMTRNLGARQPGGCRAPVLTGTEMLPLVATVASYQAHDAVG